MYGMMAEPIELPFGGLTHVGQWNHILDANQDRMSLFAAARSGKTLMLPFIKILSPLNITLFEIKAKGQYWPLTCKTQIIIQCSICEQ